MNKKLLALSMGVLLAVGANAQNNNSQAVIPWKANGNQAASEHFIGTINQTDLVFKSNSLEGIRLLTDGNIRLEQLKLQTGEETLDLPRFMVLQNDGTIKVVQGQELAEMLLVQVPNKFEPCLHVLENPNGGGSGGGVNYTISWKPIAGNPAKLVAQDDCANVHVGINTDNPQQALHVVGNSLIKGTQGFNSSNDEATMFLGDNNHFIKSVWGSGVRIGTFQAPNAITINQVSGRIGIGTTTPQAALDVNGWISLGGGVAGGYGAAVGAPSGSGGIYFPSTPNDFIRITSEHDGVDNSQLVFYTADNASDGVVFRNTDCCGGGTKDYLVVNRANINYCGVIRSQEIIVESNPNGWCDYVFEESYQRMTLEEKEKFVKENKHLPMVTPGAEIEEKGLSVGENMKGFVYNLENLTLDQIELYKMIQNLQKQQELLQQKIEQLEEENKQLKNK